MSLTGQNWDLAQLVEGLVALVIIFLWGTKVHVTSCVLTSEEFSGTCSPEMKDFLQPYY